MASRIGKYSVEKELGQGGFGKVYLAFDPDVGQPVAIKRLRAEGDPDLLKRFQLEIRTTASLRHKNIVTIHASGEEDGHPYLVMEFLEGRTLKQIIQERIPLSLLEKVRIMTQVAEGLGYANSKGVVHRDVKPENIMLLPDDNVKIMDFGIALGPDRNATVTQTGGIIGTPPYFAPEQLTGNKANEQSDIFSFGDVYYELLTGVHPFEQYKQDWRLLQVAIMSYEPSPIGELVPGCPEALETLVYRTLAKEPEFRYKKFEEVQLDSEAILVDLRHEGADAILREVPSLMLSDDLQTALAKIREAYRLEPGNREVRRLREEINLRVQREQVDSRLTTLLADAAKQLTERRYAEAIQSLELGARLDTTNIAIRARLADARALFDASTKANRLVSEARFQHQKGMLTEAHARLQEALAIDPGHTEARRLNQRVGDDLERQREDQRRQQAIQAARSHLAARRFAEAVAILNDIEKERPGTAGVTELRAEIQRAQAEDARRQRTEWFNMAVSRTRDTMHSGDLERAGQMVDHLEANFRGEPDALEALRELRARLADHIRAREIAQFQEKARNLLKSESLREALDLLAEARHRFPGDTGLEQLNNSAEGLYRARQRSEAIATVLNEANSRRDAGDAPGALDAIARGRRNLGDEAAFTDLARQLELEVERQRYATALQRLLKDGTELIAAGRSTEAINRIETAREFGAEAEVHALLNSARVAAAAEEERRWVNEALTSARKLQSEGAWSQALAVMEQGLSRYPRNEALTRNIGLLRDRAEKERVGSAIERQRALIRAEIESRQWARATEALRAARAEFAGASAFDDLAAKVEAGQYEDGWRVVEARVGECLAANALSEARRNLEDQATRTMYANDPRWKALERGVGERREYEAALLEADGRLKQGRLAEAEQVLTEIIDRGPSDQRAQQMRSAIQARISEASRQGEIARIAQELREHLRRDDLARVASELAAARSRYPGENVWPELQTGLDARQQALGRATDIAAAAESVRRSLGGHDIQQAAAVLAAARAKFPDEAVWTALEAEIDGQQAILKRQQEIAAIAEGVRRYLRLDHRRDLPAALVLSGRREDLQRAVAKLDEGRATYSGEATWDTLQAAINGHRALLDAEDEIAGRVRQFLQRDDAGHAEAELAAARSQFADEIFWGILLAEIRSRKALLDLREEVARIAESVRARLQRDDLRGAAAELSTAQAKHPDQGVWAILQKDIDSRQALEARQAEVAAAAHNMRARLQQDDVAQGTALLTAMRAKYPGEALWATIQGEVDARHAEIEEAGNLAMALLQQGRPEDALALFEGRPARQARFADLLAQARAALERQRRREARERDRERLLAIERQTETPLPKRKRKELDHEAQAVAAAYADDEEIAPIAARVHSRIAALAGPSTREPIPWKLIGGGAAAAAAIAAVLAVSLHKQTAQLPPLHAATIPIEIRTDPPGANVRIGTSSCQTPNCRLDLAPGRYLVETQLKEYEPKQQTVVLDASNHLVELTLRPLPPPPQKPGQPAAATGTLVVQAGVPDALVYVDGVARDRTDQSGSLTLLLEAEAHEVRVERHDYDSPAPRRVRIAVGSRETVAMPLTLQVAKLELQGAPAGVAVSAGGKALGLTDGSATFLFPASVTPGDQPLQVTLGSVNRTIRQRFGPGQTLHLEWKDVAPAAPASLPPAPETLEAQAWDLVRSSSDVTPLRAFLQKYRNGAHAREAESRIADLVWGAVDQNNPAAVRRFLSDHPDNPHRLDAQTIVDQFDAHSGQESAKQEGLKQGLAQPQVSEQQDQLRRQQVLATVKQLDSALQRRRTKDVKAIWPSASRMILESLGTPGVKLSVIAKEGDVRFSQPPDRATVEGDLVTNQAHQKATLTLRNTGGVWIVESARFD